MNLQYEGLHFISFKCSRYGHKESMHVETVMTQGTSFDNVNIVEKQGKWSNSEAAPLVNVMDGAILNQPLKGGKP